MASPFGAGDIIAVTTMLYNLYTALENTRKVPVEFQTTVQTLYQLHRMFKGMREDPDSGPSSSTPSSALENWTHAMKDDLAREIREIKLLVEEASEILIRGYIITPAEGRFLELRRLKKRLKWPQTRIAFDSCLSRLDRSLLCVNHLMVRAQDKKQDQLFEGIAAIRLDINRKPPAMGLPGSGGLPEDHIGFRDGLGRIVHLITNICETPTKLHRYFEILYEDLPGRDHIQKHLYRLFSTTTTTNSSRTSTPCQIGEDNWRQEMSPGSTCQIAFVVGTWQMGCLNFCPNCNAEQRGDWNSWRHCSCGSTYYITDVDEAEYGSDPPDGHWHGSAKDLTKRKKRPSGTKYERSGEIGTSGKTSSKWTTEQQRSSHEQQGSVGFDSTAMDDLDDSDEDYFRSMIMVYNPMINFVCRNIFCRCILGATSLASPETTIDLLCIMQPCLQHAPNGTPANLKPDYVVNVHRDYNQDPYFEKFGGYQDFLKCARYVTQQIGIACLFTDVAGLYPTEISAEDLSSWTKEQFAAMDEYRADILPKLRELWMSKMRTRWEMHDSEVAALIDAQLDTKQREVTGHSPLYFEPNSKMAAVLYRGRVMWEKMETIMQDETMCPIW